MPDEMPTGTRSWSEALRRLFAAKHYASRRLLNALDLPDSAELLEAAATPEPTLSRGDRVKALTAAMHVDPARTVDLLGEILSDESADTTLRGVAASLLGRSSLPVAEEVLIRHVDEREGVVRLEVVAALGRVGGVRAYDALTEAARSESISLRRQAVFARAMIAYRHGLEPDPLPPAQGPVEPPPEQGVETVEINVRNMDGDRIAYCLDSLEDSTFGIEVDLDLGFWVTAGRAEWALLLNGQLGQDELARSLMERRKVVGILARRSRETDTFASQYLILSRPAVGDTAELMVYRTDGELFYAGRASARGGQLEFAVAHADRPGAAPTYARGSLGPAGVTFTHTVPRARRREKRQTSPLDLRIR